MREYLFYGLMRSGNHAVIEWIAAHFDHTEHFNDIDRPKGGNSFRIYGDSALPVDCRIFSVEGTLPFSKEGIEEYEGHPIAIFRDYFNTQASMIRFGKKFPWAINEYKRHKVLWIKYAEQYLKTPEKFIVYNRWVQDDEYLIELEKRYGWRQIKRITTLPQSKIGRGSSFNGEEHLDYACLNKRWEFMDVSDEMWIDAINNNGAKDLNKEIFGWTLSLNH